MKRLATITIVGAFLFCSSVWAAEEASPSGYEHLKPLEWTIGEWTGQYTAPADVGAVKEGDRVTVHWSVRWMLDKSFIVNDSYSEVEGRRIFDGREIIGWDWERNKATHSIFCTLGSGNGVWFPIGDKAVLRWSINGKDGRLEGTSFVEKQGADTYVWQMKDLSLAEEKLPDYPKVAFKRKTIATTGIPEEALEEMRFRVGKWESDLFIDGEETGSSFREVTKWAPGGKYCLHITQSGVENGAARHGSSVMGWDPEKRQLVEHWHVSDGVCVSYYYHIDKSENAWIGTFRYVGADGKKVEGESVVERRSNDEWTWKASWTEEGKTRTRGAVSRRVK